MSTYREIHGKAVKSLDTDPSADTDAGQIWYNTSSDTFKSIVASAAWSSSANIATARATTGAGGIPTAAWIAGGTASTPNSGLAITEEFNGSGWSAGGNLNQARGYSDGSGTQTAGLQVGGAPTSPVVGQTYVEEYNGTAWTAVTGTPHGLWQNSVFGIQTAAVSAGQEPGPSSAVFNYNGSSWTTGGTMTTTRGYVASAGTQTAGWIGGGSPATGDNYTEHYDGSSWTASANLASPSSSYSAGANGSQTASIYFGGKPNTPAVSLTNTETFDGSSWTASAAMGTGADEMGSANNGTSNSTALSAGGFPNGAGPGLSVTEEFNQGTNVITAGAWASGGNMNTARYSLGGFGTATAGVAMCGRDSPIYQATEEYDGSSWTTVNNYPQTVNDLGSTGVLTAGLGLGGLDPPSIPSWPTTGVLTGEYDGTNWTTGGSYPYTAWGTECAGTQTATVAGGGHNYPMPPGNKNNSSEYDGSSWTAGNTMSQARAIFASSGSQTAALFTGGRSSPGVEDPTNKTEEYDGTNFSSGGNYITAIKENTQGGGPQTAAYMAGGTIPPATTNTAHYDGTAWATAPSLPAAKNLGNAASNTADNTTGLVFGGLGPSTTNTTFDFTAETTAINVKTLTQS